MKLLHWCFLSEYQPFPLFLIHYHWRSTQNISLSRLRHLVPVWWLRFSPVHLACFCQQMCVLRASVHARSCIDVAVGVHTIEEEGELRAFSANIQWIGFFLPGRAERQESKGWWGSSAWVCQGYWCTSKDDLGGLRMKAEWNFQRTLRGGRQNLPVICHHADKWFGSEKV